MTQELELEIVSISDEALPTITVRFLLTRGGERVNSQESVQYELIEDGTQLNTTVLCEGDYNSVAFVIGDFPYLLLDTNAVSYMKDGFERVLRSLPGNDEYLIASFKDSANGVIDVPFTADITEGLEFIDEIDSQPYFLGSPLYHTVMLALERLSARNGRRYCVVLSAFSNSNIIDYHKTAASDISQFAIDNKIALYNIRWEYYNIPDPPLTGIGDYDLMRIAPRTGGKSYTIQKPDLNQLSDTLAHILNEIQSPYCTLIYDGENCIDSIRHIELTATVEGETVTADTLFHSAFRPDTISLQLQALDENIVPYRPFDVFLRLSPGLSTRLPLEFSFLIKYDPELMFMYRKAIIDSMMTGSEPVLEDISEGVIRCSYSQNYPVFGNGSLLGFKFNAVLKDSSRPAFIVIDSVSLTNGCPNTVITYPDTIYICNCELEVNATALPAFVATGEEMRVPFELSQTLYPERALFTSLIHFDPEYLTPIGVDGIGAMTEDARLEWRLRAPDTLEVRADEGFMPKDGRTLFYARFRVKQPKAAVESHLSVPYVRAFSDCCYGLEKTSTTSILIDGECEKIVRRAGEFTLAQNAPNPARGETSFRFTVHSKGALDGKPALLTLYRSDGKAIAELYNQPIADGEYTVPYSTADLPAGMYYVVLTIGEESQTRSVVVE